MSTREERTPLLSSYKKHRKIQIRYLVYGMYTTAALLISCLRNIFSVALTVMAKQEPQNLTNFSVQNLFTGEQPGEFDWDAKTQQLLISAFFYGYATTTMPGGWLADTLGAKRVLSIAMLFIFTLNALVPLAARRNVWILAVIRVLDGVHQGLIFPSMYSIIGKWAPPNERSLATSAVYAGICLGFIVSSYASAFFCSLTLDGGWPLTFYVFSFIGIIFCLFWMWFPIGEPERHPWMSEREKELLSSLENSENQTEKPCLSWSGMLTSVPFWALFISYSGFQLGYFFGISNVPMFFTAILKFDVEKTCLLVSLAYLAQMILFLAAAIVSDYLISKETIAILSIRKITTALSTMSAVFLIVLGYVENSPLVGTLCMIGVVGAYGLTGPGIESNFMDIAPNHCGTVTGIVMSVSNATGFISPIILGTIVEKENTIEQWRIVFFIIAVAHIFGVLIFLVFGDANQQEWDKRKPPSGQKKRFLQNFGISWKYLKSKYELKT